MYPFFFKQILILYILCLNIPHGDIQKKYILVLVLRGTLLLFENKYQS